MLQLCTFQYSAWMFMGSFIPHIPGKVKFLSNPPCLPPKKSQAPLTLVVLTGIALEKVGLLSALSQHQSLHRSAGVEARFVKKQLFLPAGFTRAEASLLTETPWLSACLRSLKHPLGGDRGLFLSHQPTHHGHTAPDLNYL